MHSSPYKYYTFIRPLELNTHKYDEYEYIVKWFYSVIIITNQITPNTVTVRNSEIFSSVNETRVKSHMGLSCEPKNNKLSVNDCTHFNIARFGFRKWFHLFFFRFISLIWIAYMWWVRACNINIIHVSSEHSSQSNYGNFGRFEFIQRKNDKS